jgi:hypothetical protein
MESGEQALITMLRRLPIPITITWRSDLYHWECVQETGTSSHLITATETALRFLARHLDRPGGDRGERKGPR